jgi:hypothetical protein
MSERRPGARGLIIDTRHTKFPWIEVNGVVYKGLPIEKISDPIDEQIALDYIAELRKQEGDQFFNTEAYSYPAYEGPMDKPATTESERSRTQNFLDNLDS